MATSKTVVELGMAREIGAQSRLGWAKKSEFIIGWDAASRPEVLDVLTAYDKAAVDSTVAVLVARFS